MPKYEKHDLTIAELTVGDLVRPMFVNDDVVLRVTQHHRCGNHEDYFHFYLEHVHGMCRSGEGFAHGESHVTVLLPITRHVALSGTDWIATVKEGMAQ